MNRVPWRALADRECLGIRVPTWTTLSVFAGVATVVLVTPGPSVLYVVTRSAAEGPGAGFMSALGVETGSLVHAILTALGLSALLSSSATGYAVLRLAGGAYLIGLGLYQLIRRRTTRDSRPASVSSRGRLWLHGFVVDVVNPKAILFFVAFLPQFVDPRRGAIWPQILVLGLVFVVLGLCTDSLYALAAGSIGARLRRRRNNTGGRSRRVVGAVYVGFGVAAVVTGHASKT